MTRILTDTNTIYWDFAVAGQAKAHIVVGSQAGVYQLLPGTTSVELQAALDDTNNAEIILPSGMTTVTAVTWIRRPLWLHGHADGTSVLLANSDLTDYGTSHQIAIAESAAIAGRVEISGFALEHNRVASPDMRCSGIDLWRHCEELSIHDMTGLNLTSDFFLGRPYPWTTIGGCNLLEFYNITIDGVWEGVWNWHSGHLRNAYAWNVHVTADTSHVGYQGPMLFELNVEQEVGSVENAVFSDSSMTLTGTAAFATGQSPLGIAIAANTPKGACWYDKTHFHNVTIDGALYGAYMASINYSEGPLPAQQTLSTFTDCHFNDCGNPYYLLTTSQEAPSLQIVGNLLVRGAALGYNHWNTSFAADQEVIATNVVELALLELFVRSQTKSGYADGYQVYFPDATTAKLYKRFEGVSTQMGANIAVTHSANDDWKLRAVGAGPVTVTLYKNDVEVDNRVDSAADAIVSAGYVGVGIGGATTSIDAIGGGAVATTGTLDSFNRADEDPVDPANWTVSGGWRSGSANDTLVFVRCDGNGNNPVVDQTDAGTNGDVVIVEVPNPNAW